MITIMNKFNSAVQPIKKDKIALIKEKEIKIFFLPKLSERYPAITEEKTPDKWIENPIIIPTVTVVIDILLIIIILKKKS